MKRTAGKLILRGWEPFRVNPFRMNPVYAGFKFCFTQAKAHLSHLTCGYQEFKHFCM